MSIETATVKPNVDRRKGPPPAPKYGELLVESGWRPTDPTTVANDNWLRAFGLAPDRRQRKEKR